MNDERYTFAEARTRLEEIVTQVRKKDTSLEKSLDLLEEGVHLANVCTELSENTEWDTIVDGELSEGPKSEEDSNEGSGPSSDIQAFQDGSPDGVDRPADGTIQET